MIKNAVKTSNLKTKKIDVKELSKVAGGTDSTFKCNICKKVPDEHPFVHMFTCKG